MKLTSLGNLFLEVFIFLSELGIQGFKLIVNFLHLFLVLNVAGTTETTFAAAVGGQFFFGLWKPDLSNAFLSTVAWSWKVGELSCAAIPLQRHIHVSMISNNRPFKGGTKTPLSHLIPKPNFKIMWRVWAWVFNLVLTWSLNNHAVFDYAIITSLRIIKLRPVQWILREMLVAFFIKRYGATSLRVLLWTLSVCPLVPILAYDCLLFIFLLFALALTTVIGSLIRLSPVVFKEW